MTGKGQIVFFMKDAGGFVAFRAVNPSENIHFETEGDILAFSNQLQQLLSDLAQQRRQKVLEQETSGGLLDAAGKPLEISADEETEEEE
jgi:hypothetical protein